MCMQVEPPPLHYFVFSHRRARARTQTVAVFLCQCLMRGWESGDLTAVKSSCSLELPPVPIRSLKTTTHTRTHAHARNMQTHLTNCIRWFSHPVAPLSVFSACKQLTAAGWEQLFDRSYRDQGNINWYVWYSSPACTRWQRKRHFQRDLSLLCLSSDTAEWWRPERPELIGAPRYADRRAPPNLNTGSHNDPWQTKAPCTRERKQSTCMYVSKKNNP